MILKTNNLYKAYGNHLVLSDVSISVRENSVYGLVGPNGAGKTTLLSILASLRKPSEGSVTINVPRGKIAVCPDSPAFEPWLTAIEIVKLAGHLSGVPCSDTRANKLLDESGLGDAANRKAGGFSRGMTQRLALACTLVGRPKLIILDEPSSALDPRGRVEVLDIITRMSKNATIIFSSHILADVQRVCDTIGILKKGKLLYEGSMQVFLDSEVKSAWELTVRNNSKGFFKALRDSHWIERMEKLNEHKFRIESNTAADMEDNILNFLTKSKVTLVSLEPIENDLEHAFLSLTEKETP